MKKKEVILYVIATYVVFLLSILMAGGIMLISNNPVVGKLAVIPCSWTPTLVLLVMLPRFYKGISRKEYIRNLFAEKINFGLLLSVMVVQVVFFVASLVCVTGGKNIMASLSLSGSAVLWNLISNLFSGATGEEAGWRGFLHPILTKRYGLVKGSVLVGIIWGFWHAPLWFLTSGYTGIQLVKYIVCFMLFIVSTAVIMGICYDKNQNIIMSMGIHFGVNFTLGFYNGDVISIIGFIAIFYFVAAVVASIYNNMRNKSVV